MIQSKEVLTSKDARETEISILRRFYSPHALESKLLCIISDNVIDDKPIERDEAVRVLFVSTINTFLEEVEKNNPLDPNDFAAMRSHIRGRNNAIIHEAPRLRRIMTPENGGLAGVGVEPTPPVFRDPTDVRLPEAPRGYATPIPATAAPVHIVVDQTDPRAVRADPAMVRHQVVTNTAMPAHAVEEFGRLAQAAELGRNPFYRQIEEDTVREGD